MEYGINIDFFLKKIGARKAAELIKKAGFTMLDYTPPVMDDNWESVMKENLKIFEGYGLKVNQTHMPFNRYGNYADKHKLCLDRCSYATAFMGAKYAVAHADEFDFDNMLFSPEAAFEYNYKLFLPYVEEAEKNGYSVAFETVFEDGFKGRRRFTSKAEELMEMIKAFKSEKAVCCWDFGHANVSFGKDAAKYVRDFGSLIKCTHLHDNAGNDSHQMPMTGDINWKEVMGAFHDIGYSETLSVEYAHGSMPESLIEKFLELTFSTAKHLWSL